jgi:predicted nuclease of predicted toxin-antitoxin system
MKHPTPATVTWNRGNRSRAAVRPRRSFTAARLSIDHGIAMADSIVLATAQRNEAILWTQDAGRRTQDADFEGLVGTRYVAKR